LSRFDAERDLFITYLHNPYLATSISSNRIFTIYQDRAGSLWVGTNGGGLNRFDPVSETFTAYTEKEGLANNIVCGILEDNDGNLWLSTGNGLSCFNPKTGTFRNYDQLDGLQSSRFNPGACFQSSKGELFFGGTGGLNKFLPEQIKDNTYIPPLSITSFKIFDRTLAKVNEALAQSAIGRQATPLQLAYNENYLSFEFSSLNFTHPEKNQYAYMLEGFDSGWNRCGTRRYVSYTNLDAGEYVFRVKGTNNDGLWNEQGASIRIHISPPPWRTLWAYGLYLSSIVGAGFWFIRYRIRKEQTAAKLKEIELRAQVAEAKAEVSEAQAQAARELSERNKILAEMNSELAQKNEELIQSHKRADRIFSALAEALPGTVLDEKYRLDEKIGSGGFGAVYRATHLAMKRPIAVKVFKPLPGNDSAEALARFEQEAVSSCRINHPNAVAVLDSDISSEGIAYLVMELLEGHSLSDELKQRRVLSLGRSAEVLLPICDLLSKAHSSGIIHRDIKPENIFLHRSDGEETVKVVDFGIAKLVREEWGTAAQSLTGTGTLIGTPLYMAPERLSNKPYDGKADVYSLGVILYEMLSGELPFYSTEGAWQTALMHLTMEPLPLRLLNPRIPEAVEAAVLRALAKEPEKRPDAMQLKQEFLRALELDPDLQPTGNFKEVIYERLGHEIETEEFSVESKRGASRSESIDGLTNESLGQAERIFYSVLEREPEKRAAFLDEACAGDEALRRRVEGLIADDEKLEAMSFLRSPIADTLKKPPTEPAESIKQLPHGKPVKE
jgi:serine/threonine protein kinase